MSYNYKYLNIRILRRVRKDRELRNVNADNSGGQQFSPIAEFFSPIRLCLTSRRDLYIVVPKNASSARLKSFRKVGAPDHSN